LTAPFSGVVLSVEKRAGDQVGPYESLGMIADPSELWVVATVPEQDIDRVAVGQAAQVVLDAYLDDLYQGRILQIANQAVIWQGKKAYEVTITFDEGQEVPTSIRMGADVVIVTRAQEDVLVVPDEAIMMSGGRAYVEVVAPDGTLRQVDVELGISNGVETEIISGVEAGQTIRLP
jgi:HlyD family secretion protein